MAAGRYGVPSALAHGLQFAPGLVYECNLFEVAAAQYAEFGRHHMFEAMDVDISILSQFVFFARPPNYLSPAALQQQWATRAFESRAFKNVPPQGGL